MKTFFTDAPWNYKGSSVHGGNPPRKMSLHVDYKCKICDVPMTDMVTGILSEKERQANGRLIASSPDMFAMLEELINEAPLTEEQENKVKVLLKKAS